MNPGATSAPVSERAVYRRVARRLMPILFAGYVAAYLDRVNVGFAKLQMMSDLGFSDTVYGLGAGIFFLGYFAFEVPSNVLLHRLGARIWIARIMLTWAALSAAMMFATTPLTFYGLRFALGVAEAGFFPGIIYYLTQWFPARERARMMAYFISAIGLCGVLGGPLSGWIMQEFGGRAGLASWQWLFLLESLPSFLMGLVVLVYLPDRIADVSWLNEAEKNWLQAEIARDKAPHGEWTLWEVVIRPQVWGLGLIYFALMVGLYGVGFWMPQLIRNAGITAPLAIGLVSAVPYVIAVGSMIAVGQATGRMGGFRIALGLSFAVSALGFGTIGLMSPSVPGVMIGLVLATAGVLTAMPLFWTLPPTFLSGVAAAAGIAVINSVGNLGGFLGPYLVGFLSDATRSSSAGLYGMAVCLLGGCLLVSALPSRPPGEPPDRQPISP